MDTHTVLPLCDNYNVYIYIYVHMYMYICSSQEQRTCGTTYCSGWKGKCCGGCKVGKCGLGPHVVQSLGMSTWRNKMTSTRWSDPTCMYMNIHALVPNMHMVEYHETPQWACNKRTMSCLGWDAQPWYIAELLATELLILELLTHTSTRHSKGRICDVTVTLFVPKKPYRWKVCLPYKSRKNSIWAY